MFDRTFARALSSQIWTFCFVINLILDEQPYKMEDLKWNTIDNNDALGCVSGPNLVTMLLMAFW